MRGALSFPIKFLTGVLGLCLDMYLVIKNMILMGPFQLEIFYDSMIWPAVLHPALAVQVVYFCLGSRTSSEKAPPLKDSTLKVCVRRNTYLFNFLTFIG